MELGSGCGLVSIWLSRHIPMCVVATDLEAQLPSLRSNVQRNALPLLPPHAVSSNVDNTSIPSSSLTPMIPQLPTVTRLNWTEFRTKINQQDSLLHNHIGTTNSSVQVVGTAVDNLEQSQTRLANVHQQECPPVHLVGSDRLFPEHARETATLPKPIPLTFRQTYQSEHMGLATTDECAMIIACDVLYDRTIVDDFFAVVRSFSKRSPSRTVLLLAQKLRNYDDHELSSATSYAALPPAVDVTQIKGFVCHKVWEEAQVVIWEMWMDAE